MKNNGKSITKILLLWLIVVAIGTVSSAIGFSILANVNKYIVSIALSYASGAILVMLAESMIPEAFEVGGESKIGLAAMAGFMVAFILGRIGGLTKFKKIELMLDKLSAQVLLHHQEYDVNLEMKKNVAALLHVVVSGFDK